MVLVSLYAEQFLQIFAVLRDVASWKTIFIYCQTGIVIVADFTAHFWSQIVVVAESLQVEPNCIGLRGAAYTVESQEIREC